MIFARREFNQLEYVRNIFRWTLFHHSIKLQVFLSGQIGVEYRMFEYGPDFFPNKIGRWFAKPREAACSGVNNTHKHTQGCSLSTAIGPQHTKHLATLDFQVQV